MVTISCDKCQKSFTEGTTEGDFEIQEFLKIDYIGGYTSIFGDGEHVKLDICQYCLHDMVKDFWQRKATNNLNDYFQEPVDIIRKRDY